MKEMSEFREVQEALSYINSKELTVIMENLQEPCEYEHKGGLLIIMAVNMKHTSGSGILAACIAGERENLSSTIARLGRKVKNMYYND